MLLMQTQENRVALDAEQLLFLAVTMEILLELTLNKLLVGDVNQATVQDGRVVVQNVQGRPNRDQGMNPWGGNAAGYGEAQNRVGNVNQGQARPGQARTVKCYNCNGTGHIAWNCTQPKRPQNSEYFKDKMLLMQEQENRVALDAEQLLFLAGGPDNAFDDDVNEQPIQDLALNGFAAASAVLKPERLKVDKHGRSCTSERVEVYYECMEPFKSLMCIWVRSRSIAAIWLEKVVTPLIVPAIKGFAAASAVLKPERLKVDKHAMHTKMYLELSSGERS
nr:hypothetical protein [Tanacetum cinerariifolium]